MSSKSPEFEREFSASNMKYTPQKDMLLHLYYVAKSVSSPSPNLIPSSSTPPKPKPEPLQPFPSNFASTNGPDSLKISDEDVRATVTIGEDFLKDSQWNDKAIPNIFKEICSVEKNFLENLEGIKKDLTIIQQKKFLLEAEKEIFSAASTTLKEYIRLQKSYSQTISKLNLPNPLRSNEEHGKLVLEAFFAIYLDKDLEQQQASSAPLMDNLEKIDTILKSKKADCEKIRAELPTIASKFSYSLQVSMFQILSRRPELCTQWLKFSGVRQCSSKNKHHISQCLIELNCVVKRKNLLDAIREIGYIRPPNLVGFLESLGPNVDYSVSNILLEKKGEELKNRFIAFAEIQGTHISYRIQFFKIVYFLLEPHRSTPLTCADLKSLSVYCTPQNPLNLPEETLLAVQAAFKQKENSPATVRKVVDALIPAMEYIHQDLKTQLCAFQHSAEILEVLVRLPEIQPNLNKAHDLFSLTIRDIEALPPFLKSIFTHQDSALGRAFAKKFALLFEDQEYGPSLTKLFTLLPGSTQKFAVEHSDEELRKLRAIVDEEYTIALVPIEAESEEPAVDEFLRRIIQRRFKDKIDDLRELNDLSESKDLAEQKGCGLETSKQGHTQQKPRARSYSKSERSLASEVAKDDVVSPIISDGPRICGRILSDLKRTEHYKELVLSMSNKERSCTLVEQSIDAFIDSEVRKEIKSAAIISRTRRIQQDFLSGFSRDKEGNKEKPENLFKKMFLTELIEEEFYLILKEPLSQEAIPESYNAEIIRNKEKILKEVKQEIVGTEWHKSLKGFFKIGLDNPDFPGKNIGSISEIVNSQKFISKANEGLDLIEAEIKQHIKQEVERIFIDIKNKIARTLIEKEFDRQIQLLKDAQIFSDTLVQKLTDNKDKILKPYIKKMFAQKNTGAFMESYKTLLQHMPCHILKAFPNHFPRGGLKPNEIFSKAFLESFAKAPTSIDRKKLIRQLKPYQALKQAVESTSSIPPYNDLNQDLQRNFPSKKPLKVETPRSKKPDAHGVPPPNTPLSPIFTPIAGKARRPIPFPSLSPDPPNRKTTLSLQERGTDFKSVTETIRKKVEIKKNGWRIEYSLHGDSGGENLVQHEASFNLLRVYEGQELVLSAQPISPVVKRLSEGPRPAPTLEAGVEIKTFRHEKEDIELAVSTLVTSASLDENPVLEIHIDASEGEIPSLLKNYMQTVLSLGKARPEIWLKDPLTKKETLMPPNKIYEELKKQDRTLAEKYKGLFPDGFKKKSTFTSRQVFLPPLQKQDGARPPVRLDSGRDTLLNRLR